jgi:hypothetical protein
MADAPRAGTVTGMRLLTATALVLIAVGLSACSSTTADPVAPVALIGEEPPASAAPAQPEGDSAPAGDSSTPASQAPPACDEVPDVTVYVVKGVPQGTGTVITAEPAAPVLVVVESDTAGTLTVGGTPLRVPVQAGKPSGACFVVTTGAFPVAWNGTTVATVDTRPSGS